MPKSFAVYNILCIFGAGVGACSDTLDNVYTQVRQIIRMSPTVQLIDNKRMGCTDTVEVSDSELAIHGTHAIYKSTNPNGYRVYTATEQLDGRMVNSIYAMNANRQLVQFYEPVDFNRS